MGGQYKNNACFQNTLICGKLKLMMTYTTFESKEWAV